MGEGWKALRVSLLYALVSCLWVLYSDYLLNAAVPDPWLKAVLQTYKGWAFVALTAVLLYLVLRREFRSRVQAVRALEQERTFTGAMLDTAGALVLVLDRDGCITGFNRACEQTAGYTFAQVQGRPFWDIFLVPEELGPVQAVFQAVLAGQFPNQSENYWLTRDGRRRLIHWANTALVDEAGVVQTVVCTGIDVTEQREAEDRRRQAEARYRTLVEQIPAISYIADAGPVVATLFISPQSEAILGFAPADWVADPDLWRRQLHPDDRERVLAEMVACQARGQPFRSEYRLFTRDGRLLWFHDEAVVVGDHGSPRFLQGIRVSITERVEAEERVRRDAARLQALAEVSQAVAEASLEFQAVVDTVARRTAEVIGDACVVRLLSPDEEWLEPVAAHHPDPEKLHALQDLVVRVPLGAGEGIAGRVVRTGQPLLLPAVTPAQAREQIPSRLWPYLDRVGICSLLGAPLRANGRVIGLLICSRDTPGRPYTAGDQVFLTGLANMAAKAIANARLHATNRRQLETLGALYDGAKKMSQAVSLEQLAGDVCRTCVESFGVRLAWLSQAQPDRSMRPLAQFPPAVDYPSQINVRWDDTPEGRGPVGRAVRAQAPVVIADTMGDPTFLPWREMAAANGFTCVAAFPLVSRDEPFGALALYSDTPGFFTPELVQFLQAYTHLAAASLQKAKLYDDAQRRLQHTQALRDIDLAISGSLDLRVTLKIFLDQVCAQLGADAADVLLLNPHTQYLEYAAGRGFRTDGMSRARVRPGQGVVGRMTLENRPVFVPDLAADPHFTRGDLVQAEGFVSFLTVPLLVKGRVAGALDVFLRSRLEPTAEWLEFADTLAGQAAIAIDNAQLFADLQRSSAQLALAYDATLEGWSRALDLRDKETEGHTQRVADMSVRLARACGVADADLVHIRRGALLHDIGKMGIPDAILLKPGPLTGEEWDIMRRHPVYAYEMLAPIDYLKPAQDIPYCHHERWDGTGYPCGLKGEQIPLAARIFAVVDVYDALSSDRPYRPAWPEEKIRAYIQEQAGRQFDPRVVATFLSP